MQTAVPDIRRTQRLAAGRYEEEARPTITDVSLEHLGKRGMHINLPNTVRRLGTLNDAVPDPLPHSDGAVANVPDLQGQRLTDPQTRAAQQGIENTKLSLCCRGDLRDFFRRETGCPLLVDHWQVNELVVP